MRKKVKTKLKRRIDLDQIKIQRQQQTIQFDLKWILADNHNPTLRAISSYTLYIDSTTLARALEAFTAI